MKKIHARKISETLFELDRPVILEANRSTRRTFHGQVAKGEDGQWSIRGVIAVEKRGPNGWQVSDDVKKISQLQAGELLKLELRTEHVKNLYQGLAVLNEVADKVDATRRSGQFVVAPLRH